ncbi:MAG: COQ9 family protein [Pseudomonadota bacterium]
MTDEQSQDPMGEIRDSLLDAALPHVVFDGWSAETLTRAAEDAGIEISEAELAFPRGGVDMALSFHRRADDRLAAELAETDLSAMKIRERVAHCVRRRIELVAEDRDAVRRGATLLALPVYATDSAQAVWSTADVIWSACGDTSDDYNWYTKRAILSGVYSSTVLYWLGDESEENAATWAFLDRRIENVMQVEKLKAQVNANPLARAALAPLGAALSIVRPPHARGQRPAADPAPEPAPSET